MRRNTRNAIILLSAVASLPLSRKDQPHTNNRKLKSVTTSSTEANRSFVGGCWLRSLVSGVHDQVGNTDTGVGAPSHRNCICGAVRLGLEPDLESLFPKSRASSKS